MPSYRCIYEIDIDADSPEEATREAFSCMVDPASLPPVLDVIESDLSDPLKAHILGEFSKGLLTYVQDGNVAELRECGFVKELREAVYIGERVEEIITVDVAEL